MGFLEGRRLTEAAAAGLCASFIVADGFAKSVGSTLLGAGVPWEWMPAAAGGLFAPLLLLSVWLLRRVPAPDADDVAARAERPPMTRADRRNFLARHGVGLTLLVVAYLGITVMRSVRADFAPELWQQLGHSGQPSVFTTSELLVAALVLLANAASVLVRDNARAFAWSIVLASAGLLLALAATGLLAAHAVDGYTFMVLVGLGLYLPYVAMHTTIFERLVALTRDRGNLGFLMYLADSFGYLGYVAVMFLRKPIAGSQTDMLQFFVGVVDVAGAGPNGGGLSQGGADLGLFLSQDSGQVLFTGPRLEWVRFVPASPGDPVVDATGFARDPELWSDLAFRRQRVRALDPAKCCG
jgi:hypothetical protein